MKTIYLARLLVAGFAMLLGNGVAFSRGTDPVTVQTADNPAGESRGLLVASPLPTVTGIGPSIGFVAGGTNVTIHGTNFTGATGVAIGGVAATNVAVVSSSKIIATTCAHGAGVADVVVTTTVGSGTGAGQFAYATGSSIVVMNNADSGPGSLRQAVLNAGTNPRPVTITFSSTAFTGGAANIIHLASHAEPNAFILIDDGNGITIDGTSIPAGVTIDGGLLGFSLFMVRIADFNVRGLTLANGGGGVASTGTGGGSAFICGQGSSVTLDRCAVTGNQSVDRDGAIFNAGGTLTMTNCTLSGNQSGEGGGLSNYGIATVRNCTFVGNTGIGGGINNQAGGTLYLFNTIIAGNTDAEGLAPDLYNRHTLHLGGVNFIGSLKGSSVSASSTLLSGDPKLRPFANYGGPTMTMLPMFGSPVIDPAGGDTSSPLSTDQRGLPRVLDGDAVSGAIVDIGAVEAPVFSNANDIAFSASAYTVKEEQGTLHVTLVRNGNPSAPASVTVTSTPGTATSPADFTAVNTLVNFGPGDTSKTVDITITSDPALHEDNETFTLALSNPTGDSATISSPNTSTVTIFDAYDVTPPTVTVTTPANHALILEAAGPVINVTGSAADNQNLARVEVSLNGAAFAPASLAVAPNGKSGTFHIGLSLLIGQNTIAVRSVDLRGNLSAVAARSVTYRVVRPLDVSVGTDNEFVASGVSPGFLGVTNRIIGQSYTISAIARHGQLFDQWYVNWVPGCNITGDSAHLPTLTFTMQPDLTLEADFVTNPFTNAVTGTYNGLVLPVSPTPARIDTVGMLQNLNVMSNGTFTSTLKLDGLSLPVNGIFDVQGNARFGTTRGTELALMRAAKPSLIVTLTLDMTQGTGITGTVKQRFRGADVAVSNISAQRASYSSASKVPAALAGTSSLPYTLLFQVMAQSPAIDPQYYPLGAGYATMTVATNGTVAYSGRLADNTPISGSAPLVAGDQWPVFVSPYGGTGVLAGNAALADGDGITYDVTAADPSSLIWLRPVIATSQWYPDGWADGLTVNLVGARYIVPPAAPAMSVFPGLQPATPNTTLSFAYGLLNPSPLSFDIGITPANSIASTSPTMVITKASGLVTGSFPHSDRTRPAYQGVILQKGALKGAQGYFMTTSPKVPDGLGQSGSMSAAAK